MFYVYVLRSQCTGRRDVGWCEDREERLRRHNAGDTKSTRGGIPWVMNAFSLTRGRTATAEGGSYELQSPICRSASSFATANLRSESRSTFSWRRADELAPMPVLHSRL